MPISTLADSFEIPDNNKTLKGNLPFKVLFSLSVMKIGVYLTNKFNRISVIYLSSSTNWILLNNVCCDNRITI